MRRALRWLRRLGFALVLLVAGLLAPVGYIELACRGEAQAEPYAAILPPAHHRPESRTLLTYPEWHIVHAYDDYAQVIVAGDPHQFDYLRSISGFWSSLCALSDASGGHGGFPWETKQMVYTIGVSFSAELLAKAAYEETVGRIVTWIRGAGRAPLDDLSARQAADYAHFLQQTPWYKWDFAGDAEALAEASGTGLRDTERRLALGLEYRAKAGYARLIEAAVASVGADEPRLRMIVTGLPATMLDALDGISIVAARPEGHEIETPRYRALTHLLEEMALDGADFVEIAGNDDILFTMISDQPATDGALHSFARQGYGDWRHLHLVKVSELAGALRTMQTAGMRLEHVHDY